MTTFLKCVFMILRDMMMSDDDDDNKQGTRIELEAFELWPDAVDGTVLIADMYLKAEDA
jgi:hypothetical protein